jgi:hypothetical protein
VPEWADDAACRGRDIGIFFPPEMPRGERLSNQWSPEPALAICEGCAVRAECLNDALATGEEVGVRGGVWFRDDAYSRKLVRRGESHYREEVARLDEWGWTVTEIALQLGISTRHVQRFVAERHDARRRTA